VAVLQHSSERRHRVRAQRSDRHLWEIELELLAGSDGYWYTSASHQDGADVGGFEASEPRRSLERADDRRPAPGCLELNDFAELMLQALRPSRGGTAQKALGS